MHYDTELAAMQSIAPQLMEKTARTGRETCALVVRGKKGWRALRPMSGLHNNVILPAVLMAVVSLFTREAALCTRIRTAAVTTGRSFQAIVTKRDASRRWETCAYRAWDA